MRLLNVFALSESKASKSRQASKLPGIAHDNRIPEMADLCKSLKHETLLTLPEERCKFGQHLRFGMERISVSEAQFEMAQQISVLQVFSHLLHPVQVVPSRVSKLVDQRNFDQKSKVTLPKIIMLHDFIILSSSGSADRGVYSSSCRGCTSCSCTNCTSCLAGKSPTSPVVRVRPARKT